MILINLYGAPGAGKSTGAAYIFSKLKLAGFNAELVTEFAKDKVWEESKAVFENQAYIFGKQYFRISRCADKVDVIVTDSPLPLSIIYNTDPVLGEDFNNMVLNVANSFNSKNYYIHRAKDYNPIGRFQSETESDSVGDKIRETLDYHNIPYINIMGNTEGYDMIADDIIYTMVNQEWESE
jgi:hypothetical protein